MGVKQLWRVLEEVGETVPVQRSAGERVAVDLGSWIGQSRAVAQTAAISTLTALTRTVFHRTLNLMRLGLQLVIVVDGRAPEVKAAMLKQRSATGDASVERRQFAELARECYGLFEALGLPVIECLGEAEKMCAQLNQQGMVDACLTEDGDTLLYGAQTVYRNFTQNGKVFQWQRFSMAEVRGRLGLERQDLVVLAILGGCDYDSSGVPGVGPEQTKQLIAEIKTHHTDSLERLQSWSTDEELAGLARVHEELSTLKRDKHCSVCHHSGSQRVHTASGCDPCGTGQGCLQDAPHPCPCSHHQKERQVLPFKMELKIRAKALDKDPNFPDHRVIEEFMEEGERTPSPSWRAVDTEGVVRWAQRIKSVTQADARSKVLEMLAVTTCLHTGSGPSLSPVRIIRVCKENYVACFEVEWKSDEQDGIIVKVSKDTFTSHSPDMVKNFENSQNQVIKGQKRKKQDVNDKATQPKVTAFFNVIKRPGAPGNKSDAEQSLTAKPETQ